MAIPVEKYVDQDIGTDTGDGSVGDPYGTLQYALTQNAPANPGFRFLVDGSGTLGANLTLGGAPASPAQPVIIEGVDDAVVIDGAGLYGVLSAGAYNYTCLKNLTLTNGGTGYMVRLGSWGMIEDCEIHDHAGTHAMYLGSNSGAINCYIHDVSSIGVFMSSVPGVCHRNRVEDGTKKLTTAAIYFGSNGGVASENVVSVSGACDGISLRYNGSARSNSIYSNGGTGQGISETLVNSAWANVSNNLIEGFSGVGGIAIANGATGYIHVCAGNAFYDCTATIANSDRILVGNTDNETLSASPFVDAANGDFTPVDTGNVKDGALPQYVGLY